MEQKNSAALSNVSHVPAVSQQPRFNVKVACANPAWEAPSRSLLWRGPLLTPPERQEPRCVREVWSKQQGDPESRLRRHGVPGGRAQRDTTSFADTCHLQHRPQRKAQIYSLSSAYEGVIN